VHADEFDKVASTLHLVGVGIDTGPIIECRQYRWRGDETVASLEASVGEDCIDLLLHGVELASLGKLPTAGVAQGPGRYHGLVSPRLRRTAERKLARFLAGSGANRDSDPRRGHEYRR
jgi:methionyl-tRNA formyltransferase